nr:MAG TPA: hypothetical protein [Caudoviricetes sp.]
MENFRNVCYNLKRLSKNLFLLNDFLLCLRGKIKLELS